MVAKLMLRLPRIPRRGEIGLAQQLECWEWRAHRVVPSVVGIVGAARARVGALWRVALCAECDYMRRVYHTHTHTTQPPVY